MQKNFSLKKMIFGGGLNSNNLKKKKEKKDLEVLGGLGGLQRQKSLWHWQKKL